MIDTVAGDRIVYEIEIQGGTERLQRTLELSNMLEVVTFDDNDNPFRTDDRNVPRRNTLEFLYRSD